MEVRTQTDHSFKILNNLLLCYSQVLFLRKQYGSRLNVFAPVIDLSALSKSGSATISLLPRNKSDIAIFGGQMLGDKYSDHVVKVFFSTCLAYNIWIDMGYSPTEPKWYYLAWRVCSNTPALLNLSVIHDVYTSTLLKSDQWLRESHHVDHGVRGAINFRQVPESKVYALGQPTIEAIDELVSRIKKAHPTSSKIVWITLREEPIVYIDGAPYCLRRKNDSLRNMQSEGFSTLGWVLLSNYKTIWQIMPGSQPRA